jgi:type IV secretory pathway TrbF-like protein
MRFRRSSLRYSHTPLPQTPYQSAQQLWDERIGSARVQAYHWRVAALGSLGLALLCAVGLVWQAGRSSITPYIVQVNSQGEVTGIAPVLETYRPSDAQIEAHLSRFIRDVRSLPLDPIVLRENWLEAYDAVTARGAATLNEYARAADPFAHVGQSSIAVEVISVVRASENSFQVRWVERTYMNGALASTEHWTAILSILMQTPHDVTRLRKNPLGIYVDGLDWSRELTEGNAQGERR